MASRLSPHRQRHSDHSCCLLEHNAQVFTTPQTLKEDIGNLNLTNKLIKKCKKLDKEQRDKYIELGKMCQECEDS